jgi:KDO2-lipid IV(A) lauroyltransferase
VLKRARNHFIYLFTRAAIAFLGLTPAFAVRRTGWILGALAHTLAGRERRLARRQIAAALDLDKRSNRAALLTRGVFCHLGVSVVELCRILRSSNSAPDVVIPPSCRRTLDDALGQGRGVVFVTAHMGNWELMARCLATEGYPISTMAAKSYDPRFTRLLERGRAQFGVDGIYRGQPGSSARMLRALRRNRVLGMLIDQDTSVQSVFVPFFGKLAHTPVGAASLASRTGASIVVGSMRRRSDGTHVLEMEPFAPADDDLASTAALTLALERRIRRHPSQWVWFHKRWKTRPDSTSDTAHRKRAA